MINFKKISAIGASVLLTGMTMGVAAAASYPNPFVVGGSADVAIVYGTGEGVSALDVVQSGNIQSDLQSYMGSGSTSEGVSTTGETVSLDTGATRVYLNTSLNTARSTITKTELPTTLADSSFSGNVDATLTHSIKFVAGDTAGGDNSGKVIFAKQPKSNVDPVIGISMGTGETAYPLYNASVTMKATNFSHSDSEGETVTLFGKEYVVSTATDATDLVLFSSAEQVTLTKSGAENPSAVVTIDGTDYTVSLLNGDSTSATIEIDGVSKDITEGNSKKVGDIDVAVKSVTSSDVAGITATLLVGAEKLTFTDGSNVKKGSDDDSIAGTIAYIVGGTGACTELAVTVYRAGSSEDAIVEGDSYVDPVFGSFKLDFVGLSSPLDDEARDTIEVLTSGDDTMEAKLTDHNGYEATVEFAHNQSSLWRLADSSNNTIYTYEGANASEDEYMIIGNEDYGHFLLVETLTNSSSNDDHTKHTIVFRDQFSGEKYEPTMTSHTDGYIIIDGKQYDVNFSAVSGGTHRVQLKYPTSDSPTGDDFVIYPTIETERGARVFFYEPLTINLSSWPQGVAQGTDKNGTAGGLSLEAGSFYFPDGDGYTTVAIDDLATNGANGELWKIGGNVVNISLDATHSNYSSVTVGQLTYNFTTNRDGGSDAAAETVNQTYLFLQDPRPGQTAKIDQPALVIFERKDNNNAYEAVVIDLENDPAATSTDGVGVNDVLFSTPYYSAAATRSTDSDFEEEIDWWGTHVVSDSSDSDQKVVTITYPESQVYAQLYLGAADSAVTGGTTSSGAESLGNVLVKDSEVASVSAKNLIVVGGSCINSAAATLVGGAYCGADWTTNTGVGSGEFLIKGYSDSALATGKLALLVAGYDAADTVNAATYLTSVKPDTSSAWKGTSATSAEQIVEEA